MFTFASASGADWSGYGIFIVQTLVALALIAVVAWLLKRYGLGWLGRTSGSQRIKIVERRILDPKHALYLVELDGKTLLLGTGDIRRLEPSDSPPVLAGDEDAG